MSDTPKTPKTTKAADLPDIRARAFGALQAKLFGVKMSDAEKLAAGRRIAPMFRECINEVEGATSSEAGNG